MISNLFFSKNEIHAKFILQNSFLKTHYDLSTQSDFDVAYSGTTTTMVLMNYRKLVCANSGDSRAIMCKKIEKRKKVVIKSDSNKRN